MKNLSNPLRPIFEFVFTCRFSIKDCEANLSSSTYPVSRLILTNNYKKPGRVLRLIILELLLYCIFNRVKYSNQKTKIRLDSFVQKAFSVSLFTGTAFQLVLFICPAQGITLNPEYFRTECILIIYQKQGGGGGVNKNSRWDIKIAE